ncbi:MULTISPECIES: LLM class flavin-dependent oxidoreductase [unclassified Nocardioides]|uniref:LLM class flavin-dependent oxidoreductase n=1 Tax=unclassified Nocardioides TaxID=2615069 RepID=UPI0009F09B74|nr:MULTISPECIES: LLM class flavin-dependent oxidoreductase [unclassified Nocardioides]GAW47955.1 oxidoreductase [Nocardioides sp. PD653-B2]GAW53742.1 oxidoreductase [Nocardioides sp. PD653]
MAEIEFGLTTFGSITRGADGRAQHHAQVIREVVEAGVLADSVGVDFFGIGEHHRTDFAVSSPEMVLAGIASLTERIRLGSAVTVLSSDDPVRVFERFSSLDAISKGRAEIVAGRGSFTESFPLFGFDLSQYELLFEERLALLAALLREKPVTWQGSTRASLVDQEVYPGSERGMTAWVGVGGTPESVVRTARYGFGLLLAVIGGPADRFAPYLDLFERAQDEFGITRRPTAVHSPGLVAGSDADARRTVYDDWAAARTRMGRERGWPAPTPADFEREVVGGALYVGSPETVAKKIAATVKALGIDRFNLKFDHGGLEHPHLLRSIELYGSAVIPLVKDMLADGS